MTLHRATTIRHSQIAFLVLIVSTVVTVWALFRPLHDFVKCWIAARLLVAPIFPIVLLLREVRAREAATMVSVPAQ